MVLQKGVLVFFKTHTILRITAKKRDLCYHLRMNNELLFLLQIIAVSSAVLGALMLGKEALVACIAFLITLANLFVVKQVTLFGLQVTVTDAYIVGAVLGFNLLQEYFGKDIARKTIWISFFMSLVLVVAAQVHLGYTPNEHDFTQASYEKILGFLPRILVASFTAHVVSQYIRLFLYEKAKNLFRNQYFVVRNLSVTVVEQLVDTILFGFIGLYGVVHTVTDVFVLSFAIKMISIVCIVPLVMSVRYLLGAGNDKAR